MSQLKDFLILKKLGDGAFSSVHQVKRISDGAIYALKKVKMGKLSEKEKQNAVNEIRILASIDHPNVIGYKEAFFENKESCLCIIMELADGGDLLQSIESHKKNRTKFTEKEIWHYFIQIVRGLKALHDLKIVHRDIKCANLFITKDGVMKLGDLNVSKVAKQGLLKTQTGTPYYASPEVWKEQPYNHLSDIWSLGCVLYEMITLLPPFRAQSMAGLATKVMKGNYERIPQHFTSDLDQIVKSCLQVTPSQRPSCDQILQKPGLLNHITGTLENLDIDSDDIGKNANLLKTIRCPRNLGMITERLPAPQYQQSKMKRCNSMAIDIQKSKNFEAVTKSVEIPKIKGDFSQKLIASSKIQVSGQKKVNNEKRIGASRVICDLPTIEEDHVDDETVETGSRGKAVEYRSKLRQILDKPKKLQKIKCEMKLDYNSDSQNSNRIHQQVSQSIDDKISQVNPTCQSVQHSRQGERARVPANPKSADIYHSKPKVHLVNRMPLYNKIVGGAHLQSNASDNEDTSTRVSSKSQAHRNMSYQKRVVKNYSSGSHNNVDCLNIATHNSETPRHISSKIDNISKRYEVVRVELAKPKADVHSDLSQNGLPSLKANSRMNSVDVDRVERERRIAGYLQPQTNDSQSARGLSRYASRRNESLGVSRALGISERRYDGVGQALQLARAASRDSLQLLYNHQPRGPCPMSYRSKVETPLSQLNHKYVPVSNQPSYQTPSLNKYQSEAQILPTINYSRRQQVQSINSDYSIQQGNYPNYPVNVPVARY